MTPAQRNAIGPARLHAPRRRIAPAPLLVALMAFGGCADPKAELAVEEGQRPAAKSTTAVVMWRDEWDPIGRGLDVTTRARHFIPESIDACDGATPLLHERFDAFDADGDTWQRFGMPQYEIALLEDSNRVFRFAGVPDAERAGIARRVVLPDARGTLLCRVKTLLVNSASASRFGLPEIAFEYEDERGENHLQVWPLAPAAAPDWETQWFVWTPPRGVHDLTLTLSYDGAVASIAFDDLAVWTFRPEAPVVPPLPPRIGDNVISGGNFEVGSGGVTVSDSGSGLPTACSVVTDASVGERSLFVPITHDDSDVTFVPFHVTRTGAYVLTWRAKGIGARISATLTGAGERLEGAPVDLSPEWERASQRFEIPSSWFDRAATLTLTLTTIDAAEPGRAWIDAVSLVRGEESAVYVAPNEVEIGIIDGWDNSVDLARVLHLDQTPGFVVRCVSDAERARSCTLAIDVVDALDRVVARETAEVLLPARGAINRALPLSLPTGYFHVLASLWPGAVATGRPIAQAERSVVLGNLLDAVPRGAPCGLSVSGGACSGRLTQLGFGWVRWTPEDAGGGARFEDSARSQSLEVLLADQGSASLVEPPFPVRLIGVERSGAMLPNTRTSSGAPLLDSRGTPVSGGSKAAPAFAGDGPHIVTFEEAVLPESVVPALSRLEGASDGASGPALWDVGVPLLLSSDARFRSPDWVTSPEISAPTGVGLDPALEASLLVRRYVLRFAAGLGRIGLVPKTAFAAAPPAVEPVATSAWASIVPWMLAEADHSPLPHVAAIDYMNSRLNHAALLASMELRGDARACVIDVSGHSVVAIMWRSFGRRPSWYRLRGLVDRVRVYNAFGSPEGFHTVGEDVDVPVSTYVIYVTCAAADRQALLDALVAIRK